jgi:hypothetical protein
MPKQYDFTGTEYPPLFDVQQEHLKNCAQCQESLKGNPVSIGEKPKLCSEWFHIIYTYSEFEGKVNNVVAHDEHGNVAWSQERLL